MTLFSVTATSARAGSIGTQDGRGSADHDKPYQFGRRPRAASPFPFGLAQYARLLVLRGRVADGLFGAGDLEPVAPPAARCAASSSPRLVYACAGCGAMVGGAHQKGVLCPACRDDDKAVARRILAAALGSLS